MGNLYLVGKYRYEVEPKYPGPPGRISGTPHQATSCSWPSEDSSPRLLSSRPLVSGSAVIQGEDYEKFMKALLGHKASRSAAGFV